MSYQHLRRHSDNIPNAYQNHTRSNAPSTYQSHARSTHHPYSQGFTIIELLIVATFASLLLILFFIQKSNFDAINRDEKRRTAINAMYYALEESFYKDHGYYPEQINEDILPVVDPSLWTDPLGFNLGDSFSSYHYAPANCDNNGKCKEYILSASLEKGTSPYEKYSRNK